MFTINYYYNYKILNKEYKMKLVVQNYYVVRSFRTSFFCPYI